MKVPSDDLYLLISSMTKAEKRYFKLFSSAYNSRTSNYIKLFDIIEKQTSKSDYDETVIKENFKENKFVKQLAFTKNYLYKLILKSLNAFHSKDMPELKLMETSSSIEILFNKGLFSQCLKLIARAKDFAYENEKYIRVLDLCNLERKVLLTISSLNERKDKLVMLYEEEAKLVRIIENINCYRRLYDRTVIYGTGKGPAVNKKEEKELDEILGNPLMQNESMALSLTAKVIYYQLHCFTNMLKMDYQTAYRNGKKFLKLIEDLSCIEMFPAQYLTVKQDFSTASRVTGRIAEFEKVYDELLNKDKSFYEMLHPKIRCFLENRTLIMGFNYNLGKGEFESNLEIMDRINKNLQLSGGSFRDEKTVSYFVFAFNYFALNRLEDSLIMINKIFNLKEYELRYDIQCSCRIFNLILHYELGNFNLMEYNIRSVYRYLLKRKKLGRFEEFILGFLKRLIKTNSKKDFIELLEAVKDHLKNIYDDENEKHNFGYFNYYYWIESKVQNKPYAEIVQQGE